MTVESNDTQCVLRLEGDGTMASAAELKTALLQALQTSQDVSVEFSCVPEIDITIVQLLWAAERAAALGNRRLLIRAPETLAALARDAGFEGVFGLPPAAQARG